MPSDTWHASAMAVGRGLGRRLVVTTEANLLEFSATLSDKGPYFRARAVELIRSIQALSSVEVLEVTHDLFEAGVTLYERRPDKEYSLVDCISMVVMREREIQEVLTHDHHFEQEGFRLLL